MKCPNCGVEVVFGSKFCQNCGIRVAPDNAPSREPLTVKKTAADQAKPKSQEMLRQEGEEKRGGRNLWLPVTALICVLALVVGLVGCRLTDSPKRAVNTYLRALQSQAWSTANGVSTEADYELSLPNMAQELQSSLASSEDGQEFSDDFLGRLCDFTYTVDDVTKNGDQGTVTVTFETYDFSGFSSAILPQLYEYVLYASIMEMFGGYGGGMDLSDTDILSAMKSALAEVGEDRISTTVNLPVRKVDGTWKVDTLSTDQINAITGGLLSGASGLMDSTYGGDYDDLFGGGYEDFFSDYYGESTTAGASI